MLALEFTCQGRDLTYGAGIHDELSQIAQAVMENTGATIEHWKREGDKYTMYFLTNKLIDLILTKGNHGMDIFLNASGLLYFTPVYGLRNIRFFQMEDFV